MINIYGKKKSSEFRRFCVTSPLGRRAPKLLIKISVRISLCCSFIPSVSPTSRGFSSPPLPKEWRVLFFVLLCSFLVTPVTGHGMHEQGTFARH